MALPAKPATFSADGAPAGVEVKFYSRWQTRPLLSAPARIAAVHTNAASREGSVDSASNWAERNTWGDGNSYTIPHYQVDRDGRARKILPTNRRGICNATVLPGTAQWAKLTTAQQAEVLKHPVNVSTFSIGIETADTGTIADPTISDFTPVQAERVAEILAYESLVPGNQIPLAYPTAWYGSGVGGHTDPFPYPFWTVQRGKVCPGAKKKQSLRTLVLPRAVAIRAAWTGTVTPPVTPPVTPITPTNNIGAVEMILVMRFGGTPAGGWGGYYSADGGRTRLAVTGGMDGAARIVRAGAVDARTGVKVTDLAWSTVSHTTSDAELTKYLGA